MKKWFYRIGMLLIAISMCITTPFLFEILCGTFLFTIHFKQKEKIEKVLLFGLKKQKAYYQQV